MSTLQRDLGPKSEIDGNCLFSASSTFINSIWLVAMLGHLKANQGWSQLSIPYRFLWRTGRRSTEEHVIADLEERKAHIKRVIEDSGIWNPQFLCTTPRPTWSWILLGNFGRINFGSTSFKMLSPQKLLTHLVELFQTSSSNRKARYPFVVRIILTRLQESRFCLYDSQVNHLCVCVLIVDISTVSNMSDMSHDDINTYIRIWKSVWICLTHDCSSLDTKFQMRNKKKWLSKGSWQVNDKWLQNSINRYKP